MNYLEIVSTFDRHQLKFGDEKHLKGAELWFRKTRRNVLTGEVPPILTKSNFRNAYSIIGFYDIDERCTPVRHTISEGINDATNFGVAVQLAVSSSFLMIGDILVLDRAAIHMGGPNANLEDWLWDNFRIFCISPRKDPRVEPN